jgi:hypothetical protein
MVAIDEQKLEEAVGKVFGELGAALVLATDDSLEARP